MSEPDTVGFYASVQEGGEVWPIIRGKVVRRALKRRADLKVGKRVSVPTLFGHADAVVTEVGPDYSHAESGNLNCTLQFAQDDRHCWTSSVSCDRRVIARLQF